MSKYKATDQDRSGWAKPLISKKFHYFPASDFRSLCNTVGYWGEREGGDNDHPENCKACMKKLAIITKKAEATR